MLCMFICTQKTKKTKKQNKTKKPRNGENRRLVYCKPMDIQKTDWFCKVEDAKLMEKRKE
jgi:hypothetical protein